jgi:hypothetical protein
VADLLLHKSEKKAIIIKENKRGEKNGKNV